MVFGKLLAFKRKEQRLLFYSITALGVSHVITQIILLREFASIFYGNEIVFGLILANWMLLSGLGAFVGKYVEKVKDKTRLLLVSQILIAMLPIGMIFMIRYLRGFMFLPGLMIDITQIFLISFTLLLPYCFISGLLLVVACCIFSKELGGIGKVYFFDNIGDILGGILFSFIFIYLFNSFQSVLIVSILNLAVALLVAVFFKRKFAGFSILLLLVVSSAFLIVFDLNKMSTTFMFRGQNLLFQKDSPFGNLVVTELGGQLNFFENGLPLFTTENTIANEETVHYAMVQHEDPNKVLLISGGVAGTLNEILKYGAEIDYVELDLTVIEAGRKFTTSLDNKNINTIVMDGRLYVKTTDKKYDVAIIDLADPVTAQLNRFYTVEFFEELKSVLNADGVVSLSLGSSENYMSKEIRQLNSAIYKTLTAVFRNIIVIPGDENYFIASDRELSYDIAGMIEKRGIETEYVKGYYLSGKITEDRISAVQQSVKEEVDLNRDFVPISYYYDLLCWLSYFQFNFNLFVLLVVILFAIALYKTTPVSFSIFTTGFAATSLEVVLVVAFQILYGYVYFKIGLLVTMFFVGLALGSFYMNRTIKKRNKLDLVKIETAVLVYSVFLPIVLIFLKGLDSSGLVFLSSQIIFPLLIALLAVLVGMEFPLASKLHFKKVAGTAGHLYYSDFIGACLGALLAATFLIPILGLVNTCLIVGLLNLISGLAVFRSIR